MALCVPIGLAMEGPGGHGREEIYIGVFVSLGLFASRSLRLAVLGTQLSSIPSPCFLASGWSWPLCDQPPAAALVPVVPLHLVQCLH